MVGGRLGVWLGAAAVVASAAIGVGGARAERVPLRSIDWDAVIRADPRIVVPEECFRFIVDFGPCVEIRTDGASAAGMAGLGPVGETIVGYVNLDEGQIDYGDLDGDEAEEAVLRVESGGTAGTIGFLLYREGDPAPELLAARAGYKVFPRIRDGLLLVSEPVYFGFEGNCCPTGGVQSAFVVRAGRLEEAVIPGVSPQYFIAGQEEARPATYAELTVVAFYRALSTRRHEDAYALLSPAFQAGHPFDAWRAGYATTRSIEVETRAGREGNDPSDGRYVYEVLVTLTAIDDSPSGEGVTSCFDGRWFLIKGSEGGPRLVLDAASIGVA